MEIIGSSALHPMFTTLDVFLQQSRPNNLETSPRNWKNLKQDVKQLIHITSVKGFSHILR